MNKKFSDLMIDIETLGNLPTSVITSIAAVAFDRNTGEVGPEVYLPLKIQSGIDKGLTVDASTIMWWFEQSEEARKRVVEGDKNGYKLEHALFELSAFIESLQPSELKIWGNSNRFDLGILHSSFIAINKKLPWKHTLERDVRTIVEFAPEIKKNMEFTGVKHDPIDDCKHQIKYLVEIFDYISANENIARAE